MDGNTVISLIGSVGFPIVMCLILVKYMEEMNEDHKEEVNGLKESLNANTQILTKLETMFNIYLKQGDDSNDNERG